MKKLFILVCLFIAMPAFAATQVSINNLPPPPSGSAYLALGDKVPATRGSTTYGLLFPPVNGNPPGSTNNVIINDNGQYGAVVAGDGIIVSNGTISSESSLSLGIVNTKIKSFATSTVYAAGTTTYATGTYTAPIGPQPAPIALAAGQVYFANFNQTNTGATNLIMAGLPVKALKIVNGAGTVLAMTGGEIIPGPATVYYDGVEFIYSIPFTAVAVPVTTATTASVSDFINQKTYYLTSGSETITLPCANTVSQNGAIKVYSVVGTITISKGSTCSDTLNKNNTTGTSTTISQGAAPAIINTDGVSNFYISGS